MLTPPVRPYTEFQLRAFFMAYLNVEDVTESDFHKIAARVRRREKLRAELDRIGVKTVMSTSPAQMEDLIKFAMNNR